ncbi:DegT/DnrJ/EryC1/StrS family aminotransferase [Helicobacter winghamensis]|uniref:DegT/DnrJ/EryC1/StrS family aminotransferase n=1 Tax=Helicobacter winghamensis TaxID=157268 RepID=UPI001E416A92|nr:DegT/DnrJ/EryC1/StrS family aminotransferase [Helicobacter winghamensis]
MIFVSKPYLPSFAKYQKYLERIWKNHHLTNFGPLSLELEEKLSEYLGVKYLVLVSNGTLALQLAYRLVGLKVGDKVITTPFSFVATTNSLLWESISPVFSDINKDSLNLDINQLPKYLSADVKAMVCVHVFGNPCEVESLQEYSNRHHLKLIYDAAHAFGVRYKNKSIFEYGDISTLSFHATKIFHCVEGGAVILKNEAMFKEAREMMNFGLRDSIPVKLGINLKNSEFHAAMGLCVLEDMEYILEQRERVWSYYATHLKDDFILQTFNTQATMNYHYFPIIFESELQLIEALKRLNHSGIFPRRYFYPSLDELSFFEGGLCPVSRDIARRILCLPMFVDLNKTQQDRIINLLRGGGIIFPLYLHFYLFFILKLFFNFSFNIYLFQLLKSSYFLQVLIRNPNGVFNTKRA